ncbi:MAG: manganese efflux pump MntP family protein [Bacilli bacterium]
MKIITIILIAVSLSMDAFSLALIYGTQDITKKGKILLSTIVGIYHFIMPLIGLTLGLYVTSKIIINTNILVGIILSLIAIEMIISSFKNKEEKFLLSIPGYLLFGLSVSIDSLTTGIGLPAITDKYILSASVFSVTSLLFTFLGLNLGNILNKKYGKISTIIGGIILLVIGLLYIFK